MKGRAFEFQSDGELDSTSYSIAIEADDLMDGEQGFW